MSVQRRSWHLAGTQETETDEEEGGRGLILDVPMACDQATLIWRVYQGALLQPQIQRHVQKYLKQLRCSSKSLVQMSVDKREINYTDSQWMLSLSSKTPACQALTASFERVTGLKQNKTPTRTTQSIFLRKLKTQRYEYHSVGEYAYKDNIFSEKARNGKPRRLGGGQWWPGVG